MKNSITNRYEKNQNDELVLNISAVKVEDLFEDYDKKSTFIKKDLKESLEKYLIESVEEIGEHPFIIKFYFDEISDEESNQKVRNSIKDDCANKKLFYFSYYWFCFCLYLF